MPLFIRSLRGLFRLILATWLLVLALPATTASAAGFQPVDASAMYSLTGNRAGSFANFAFVVPPNTIQPVVSVQFSPTTLVIGGGAGFKVLLDGTSVGFGTTTTTPGLVTFTMPKSPPGAATVEVFSYDGNTPAAFTISVSNLPGQAPNGPLGKNSNPATPAPVNTGLSQTLAANSGGSFAYFSFPSPGGTPPTTVSLTYSPANSMVSQAVGFTVFDEWANNIGSVAQPATQNFTAGTLTVDLSRPVGEHLTIQVFNYTNGITISFRLSVAGISPPISNASTGGPAGFQPFWVENFMPTALWSGADANAASFGVQPAFSSFLVSLPQTSSRLYVYNPRTHNFAFIDAAACGPSGPPAGY
jgi:hypothetical protein